MVTKEISLNDNKWVIEKIDRDHFYYYPKGNTDKGLPHHIEEARNVGLIGFYEVVRNHLRMV